jgi:hypothetical protein
MLAIENKTPLRVLVTMMRSLATNDAHSRQVIFLGVVVVSCAQAVAAPIVDDNLSRQPCPLEGRPCEDFSGRIDGLREAGVVGTIIGTEELPKECTGIETGATAVAHAGNECLVSCDRGEWGGHVAIYSPNAMSARDGRRTNLPIAMAYVVVGDVIFAFHHFRSGARVAECGGSVARLVRRGGKWEEQLISDLPAPPLAYTREANALVVELGCPSWYAGGVPAGDWQRSRVRITATDIQPMP